MVRTITSETQLRYLDWVEDRARRVAELSDGRIGYVMTNLFWSVYQTEDSKEECPRGFNDGPREQFTALFPDHESMSVEETQLKQEIQTWHPTDEPDGFEFLETLGTKAIDGVDQDDRVVHHDADKHDATDQDDDAHRRLCRE